MLYRKDDGIYISARSLGEINVQVLVETLGGGGNSTTAGGQCSGMTVAEAKATLLRAIDKYLKNKEDYFHESDFAAGCPG